MFSGQGSQYFQMGQALYAHEPVFRDWMDRLDATARPLAGQSIVAALYGGQPKSVPFDRTLLSSPAIFMVQYALAQVLNARGIEPDLVLGTSLGAFVATAVAGCIDPHDALRVLIGHARTLEAHCEPGTMIAVLEHAELFRSAGLARHAELASLNFERHFVVSAPLPGAAEVERLLRERNVTHQRLPVSFAFHSRWTRDAEASLQHSLDALPARAPRIPLACCARACISEDSAATLLMAAVREPICFQRTIRALASLGSWDYVDAGPSGTLATFARYALAPDVPPTRIHAAMTPFGRDIESVGAVQERLGRRAKESV